MSDTQAKWLLHDGGPQPVPDDAIVEAYDLEGDFYEADTADTLCWQHKGDIPATWWIVRYRVIVPAGTAALAAHEASA